MAEYAEGRIYIGQDVWYRSDLGWDSRDEPGGKGIWGYLEECTEVFWDGKAEAS